MRIGISTASRVEFQKHIKNPVYQKFEICIHVMLRQCGGIYFVFPSNPCSYIWPCTFCMFEIFIELSTPQPRFRFDGSCVETEF